MKLIRWDPWKELQSLRANTDRLWDRFFDKLTHETPESQRVAFLPDVDVVETSTEYRVYVSIPGVIEEDIDLEIGPTALVIRGERQAPYDATHPRHVGEWRYGYFERRITLTLPIRTDAVVVDFDSGVLAIRSPKR